MHCKNHSTVISGIALTLTGAILFSTKAVLAKIIYRDISISVVSLLTLRMLFALPFYVGMLLYALPEYRRLRSDADQAQHKRNRVSIFQCVVVGMVGYYLSSFLDFSGLKFISAGLERIILFMYPTFTVLFAALIFKARITLYQVLALFISYLGISLAFAGDINQGQSPDIFKGSLLVFGCAVTYSLYVLLSGSLIPKVGVVFFTAVGMISATAGVFIHFLFSNERLSELTQYATNIYLYILLMAVLATVLPSLALSMGLRRIGSSNVAIISSIGPMATILQAYWFLGEAFGWLQAMGTVLVIAGVLVIGRKARPVKILPSKLVAE